MHVVCYLMSLASPWMAHLDANENYSLLCYVWSMMVALYKTYQLLDMHVWTCSLLQIWLCHNTHEAMLLLKPGKVSTGKTLILAPGQAPAMALHVLTSWSHHGEAMMKFQIRINRFTLHCPVSTKQPGFCINHNLHTVFKGSTPCSTWL